MSKVDELIDEIFGVPPEFECAKCRRMTDTTKVELDAECRPVCQECYLSDIPEEDLLGTLYDIESERG